MHDYLELRKSCKGKMLWFKIRIIKDDETLATKIVRAY